MLFLIPQVSQLYIDSLLSPGVCILFVVCHVACCMTMRVGSQVSPRIPVCLAPSMALPADPAVVSHCINLQSSPPVITAADADSSKPCCSNRMSICRALLLTHTSSQVASQESACCYLACNLRQELTILHVRCCNVNLEYGMLDQNCNSVMKAMHADAARPGSWLP